MRKNNLEAWTYTSSLNCLLFFAQRMDELLFHHTTDSYRYSVNPQTWVPGIKNPR